MLQSLDTLIAFVVIMTVVSLFVTIIVQMVSAALSLRGKNLANALALTFRRSTRNSPKRPSTRRQNSHRSAPFRIHAHRQGKNSSSVLTDQKRAWHFTDIFDATRLATAIRPRKFTQPSKNPEHKATAPVRHRAGRQAAPNWQAERKKLTTAPDGKAKEAAKAPSPRPKMSEASPPGPKTYTTPLQRPPTKSSSAGLTRDKTPRSRATSEPSLN